MAFRRARTFAGTPKPGGRYAFCGVSSRFRSVAEIRVYAAPHRRDAMCSPEAASGMSNRKNGSVYTLLAYHSRKHPKPPKKHSARSVRPMLRLSSVRFQRMTEAMMPTAANM